jgi:hypothetical protein
MDGFIKVLIALAGLAFVVAIGASLRASGMILDTDAEGYSRASSNLALLAIALTLAWKQRSATT